MGQTHAFARKRKLRRPAPLDRQLPQLRHASDIADKRDEAAIRRKAGCVGGANVQIAINAEFCGHEISFGLTVQSAWYSIANRAATRRIHRSPHDLSSLTNHENGD